MFNAGVEIADFVYFFAAGGGWLLAQAIKILVSLGSNTPVKVKDFLTSGGMPSSHAALTTSVITIIALSEGIDTALFGLAFMVWAIILYDSIGVRRATGENTRILRELHYQLNGKKSNKSLTTSMGHTPYQVFVGSILGILWGMSLYFAFLSAG